MVLIELDLFNKDWKFWSKSDPYVTFNELKNFDNAFDKKLLPINEIEQRRKENRLTLVKKLFIKRSKWKDAVPYINDTYIINQ